MSISSTFYAQLLRQYFCTKLQSQNTCREKLCKAQLNEKVTNKMLVKLTKRTPSKSLTMTKNMYWSLIQMVWQCPEILVLSSIWNVQHWHKKVSKLFLMKQSELSFTNHPNPRKFNIAKSFEDNSKIKTIV